MREVLSNHILIGALLSWAIAQIIKIPLEFLSTRRWKWTLLFDPGGMPSSHTALVVSIAYGIGLRAGFDSPIFALSVAVAMVVIYDATGVRRQAGKHASLINAMIQDLASGHPLKEEQLREVLGHTPMEVLGGFLLGIAVAQIAWMIGN